MKQLNYFLSMAMAASLFVACGQKKNVEAPVEEEPAVVVDPKLTAENEYETLIPATGETPAYVLINKPQVNLDEFKKDKDGFIVLFDGATFTGWRGYNKDTVPGKWIIDDGAIKINGSGQGEAHAGGGGDLIFAHKFKNFELSFDWKVSPNANSGVLYLAREIKGEPIWISSPEYQILDNNGHPDAKLGENGNRQSASLYDMIPAVPQNAKAVGEWNQGGIMVYKGTVVHKQNGKNVVEYHLWTPKWNELIAGSKFKPGGDFPLAYTLLTNLGGDEHEGYIGLQDHGDDVWYKNIRIKILE
jgi:hypothetical protein